MPKTKIYVCIFSGWSVVSYSITMSLAARASGELARYTTLREGREGRDTACYMLARLKPTSLVCIGHTHNVRTSSSLLPDLPF